MCSLAKDIGIDLGTASVLVYVKGKGVVLNEPSVVAIDKNTGKLLKVGAEAQAMLGRTPGNIVAIRPLREGVISDYDMTERMLKEFIHKVAGGFQLFKPRVIICVPSGITEVEERAVVDAGIQAGARRVYLIEEPVAAAIGAGIDIAKPDGHMVVDIGGGTADIAVISLSGVVESASIKVAGDQFNESIVKYMRRKHNILIGERTAENVKIEIGSAFPYEDEGELEIKGRNLLDGLPKNITITAEEVREALTDAVSAVVDAIRSTLETTPPELSADIIDNVRKNGDKALFEYGEKFDWPDLDANEADTQFCYALRDQLGVLADGTVVPCCLDHEGDIALGNLFEDDLDTILNSTRARGLRDGFSCRQPTEELCRRCAYATRFNK